MRLQEFPRTEKLVYPRPREIAVGWVEHALVTAHPHEQRPDELAQSLVAIAEKFNVADELLIEWIHKCIAPTTASWRMWCESYEEERQRAMEAGGNL